MMSYTRFETLLFIRNKRNLLLILLSLLFFTLYPFFFQLKESIELREIKKQELMTVDNILMPFTSEYLALDEAYLKTYDNLVDQRQLIARQLFNITSNKLEEFVENGYSLNELRFQGIVDGFAGASKLFAFNQEDLLREQALFTYLKEANMPIQTNNLTAVNAMTSSLQVYGSLLFFFVVLLISCDLFALDAEHRSILYSLPLSFWKKFHTKVGIMITMIMSSILVGVLVCFSVSSMLLEKGSFHYPVVFYTTEGYTAIPVWQYILLILSGFFIIGMFVVIGSSLGYFLFRQPYINLFVGSLCFFFPNILAMMHIPKVSSFIPMLYFKIPSILDGELATQLWNFQMDFSRGMLVCVISIPFVFFLLVWARRRGIYHVS
ncbi:hypothetical protein [Psychrobacillus sp. L4]|uniref:hypothetical protein n=1 Tax=Psychrobacillus sp. L4 TaxID=3236892 RepID=UPI0036F2044D